MKYLSCSVSDFPVFRLHLRGAAQPCRPWRVGAGQGVDRVLAGEPQGLTGGVFFLVGDRDAPSFRGGGGLRAAVASLAAHYPGLSVVCGNSW